MSRELGAIQKLGARQLTVAVGINMHFPLEALDAIRPDSGKGGLGVGAGVSDLPEVAQTQPRG